MQTIVKQLQNGGNLVSDGAWGTFLQAHGMKPGECPELWCIEHRDAVLAIPRSYIEAGADMVESNSFGANRFKLEFFGLENRTVEINRAAAAISREAAGPDRHVIASVGPTGKMLLTGEVTEEQLYDAFAEQLRGLAEGGADACCIETFTALDEATLAVKAAKAATKLEVICTFTFSRTVNGDYRTMMGISPEEMARGLIEAGADIVGANCGMGFIQMAEVVAAIRKAAGSTPILVHANAGLPKNVNGVDVFPETPAMAAAAVPALLKAGARIIGGCCGTTPAHIAAIAQQVRQSR
jgi:5-methyltetrahydrofolate--homocysteine methyltransferase